MIGENDYGTYNIIIVMVMVMMTIPVIYNLTLN